MSTKSHIAPNPATAQAFFQKPIEGPIFMLNFLKFRAKADYSSTPALQPKGTTISGQEAYQIYMTKMEALFSQMGSEIQFMGKAEAFLIGPETEQWDAILLVKYPNKNAFLAFASHEIYLQNSGHRTAALADSRLLPMLPGSIF
ncbi:MAG: hypothetical protein Sapg2KO_46420 [Saprospiraceae bacterium]